MAKREWQCKSPWAKSMAKVRAITLAIGGFRYWRARCQCHACCKLCLPSQADLNTEGSLGFCNTERKTSWHKTTAGATFADRRTGLALSVADGTIGCPTTLENVACLVSSCNTILQATNKYHRESSELLHQKTLIHAHPKRLAAASPESRRAFPATAPLAVDGRPSA